MKLRAGIELKDLRPRELQPPGNRPLRLNSQKTQQRLMYKYIMKDINIQIYPGKY